MIAAIYARKSTQQTDVAEEAKSVTRQVDGAKAFITMKGWTLDDHHIYQDDGVSGALFANRAEFQRMMRDAAAGAFQAVVFYDLDRFGRNARQTMLALNTLADLGVTIWDYSTGQAVDLDTFEGEMMTFMKARFAQQYRDQVRKHTRSAMRQKGEQGLVTGGKLFGYDNHKLGKGQTERRINNAEAEVIRIIYERFAEGDGLRTIALALNNTKALSPRAQQGRPSGWSSSSVRAVITREVYRGSVVYGKSAKAYGRELGPRSGGREKGQIPTPEDTWFRSEQWADRLRIVDADLAGRVDARRDHWKQKARSKHAPQQAFGKYLLSGGLLICKTCGGHFEAFKSPWKQDGVYVCATRRRKPGVCTNTFTTPISVADEAVLDLVEQEALGTKFIEELLALVDKGDADAMEGLAAERSRLQVEVDRLVGSIAAGVPADAVAPLIRDHHAAIAKLDVRLRAPRPAQPKVKELRAALEHRAATWRETLRAEPRVARMLLRRLIGPLEMWDPAVPCEEWTEWEASLTPALLEGLAPIQGVASPAGFEPAF